MKNRSALGCWSGTSAPTDMLFIDTEFTGLDQQKPDLISLALVDMEGREFYAELPSSHYAVQCNEWVHLNVLPHLWGGEHVQSVATIRDRLTAWLASRPGRAVIVTDCPDADFRLLRWLMPEWPNNVAPEPMLFTAWSLGDEEQPRLYEQMACYHIPERPAHHALHDAHALRVGMSYALSRGWQRDLEVSV